MVCDMLKLSLPSIACCFVTKLQDTINVAMIGRLNDKEMLSGVGLGNMTMAFLGYMAMMGINSALDTLLSQANGAGEYKLSGIYLNRGRLILCCIFVPIAFSLSFAEPILLAFKQDANVAKYAALYIHVYLPGLFL